MPAGGALFGGSASGPGSTGGVKHLVEMRAGKMNLKGSTVYPDKRKGLLYVYQSEDSLMHFCWQERTTGIVEDDLIIFPDDCEYTLVPQCTSGRAYLLKFKSSNRKFFFWLQEPRTDRDEEHCKRINEYLNNPPGNVQATNSADQDLQSLLNNMSQSQLIQLFGNVGGGAIGGLSNLLGTMSRPSTGSSRGSSTPVVSMRNHPPSTPTTAVTTTAPSQAAGAGSTTPQNAPIPVASTNAPRQAPAGAAKPTSEDSSSSSKPIQLADLQNFLLGIQPAQQGEGVDLSTALTGDALTGILTGNEDVLGQLQSHLPAVDGNVQDQLRSTLQSPQFQQAVSQFSSALESGQLGPVVSQLAVNPEAVAAASQGNMHEFVKALEKSEDEKAADKKKSDSGKDPKKKDDDEGMQLD